MAIDKASLLKRAEAWLDTEAPAHPVWLIRDLLEALASAHGAEGDQVLVIFKDGSHKFESPGDASYSANDPDWLVNVPLPAHSAQKADIMVDRRFVGMLDAPPPPKVPDSDDVKDAARYRYIFYHECVSISGQRSQKFLEGDAMQSAIDAAMLAASKGVK